MADECGNENRNPGTPCEQGDGQYKQVVLVKDGFTITNQAAFTEVAYQEGIQSGDIIPMPKHLTLEDQSSGATYEQTSLGEQTASNGTISWLFGIPANTELYKKIYSFRGSTSYGVWLITASGKIKVAIASDGTILGHGVELLNVENQSLNDGSVGEKAPLKVTIEDVDEFNTNSVVFKPAFKVARKKALTDVQVTIVGTPTATEIKFKVNKFSDNDAVEAANPVYGLDIVAFDNDFTLLDITQVAQTVAGLSGGTVATDGVYTATGVGLVTGTLNLKDPSLMTTTGYSSIGSATVTIP